MLEKPPWSVDFTPEDAKMKKLVRLAAVGAALAGAQAVAAGPAAAGGYYYCNPYGYHYAYYYAAVPCCPRYYRDVSFYRPVVRKVVRTVTYYRVVGYRQVARYYRPCCR
jgi:hypothetical protein